MLESVKNKIQQGLGNHFRGCVGGAKHSHQLDGLAVVFLRQVDPQLESDTAFSMQQNLLQDPSLQEHMQKSAVLNCVGVPQVQFHLTNMPVRNFLPLSHLA